MDNEATPREVGSNDPLGLEPKHDPWAILGRFFKTWVGSALYDGGGAEVDLEEPYEAFRAIHAQQTDALGPNVRN